MIALASDHAGFPLKQKVIEYLISKNIEYIDLGTNSEEPVDYPVYANKLADNLKNNTQSQGILICGTGIGMSIAINRHKHIRGALCKDIEATILTREHNDANVLILAGRSEDINRNYKKMVQAFIDTEFTGGRHTKRVEMLSE